MHGFYHTQFFLRFRLTIWQTFAISLFARDRGLCRRLFMSILNMV